MKIAIDFDGTCVTHEFPNLGKNIGAQRVLKQLTDKGHKLILWTMRCDNQEEVVFENGYKIHSGNFLAQAVKWFEDNDIPLWGIQRNPEQDSWTSSPKAYAQLYIDDAALGCPLIEPEYYDMRGLPRLSDRAFVNWIEVERILFEKGIL